MVILSGCSADKSDKTVDDSILGEYLNNIYEFETPVREFGKLSSYIYMDEVISVGILYPETDYRFMDKKITEWVEDLAEEYIQEAKINEDKSAELTVSYCSYSVGESTVSIKMEGTYFPSYMAHPIDIIKTFNADINKKDFIDINDIVSENHLEDFKNLVISETGANPESADEHFLDNLVISDEGIEIILNRGDYLPMSDGTKTAFFKYEDITEMLDESFSYKNDTDKTVDDDVPLTNDKTDSDIDPAKPMLALTFDDGPSGHTERLLDIFEKHGGKGTFFVVGNLIDSRKNTLIRIVNDGHEVGNHSWNHRQLTNLSSDEIKDQIMMTRAKIYDVTGIDCVIVRPPYGACNDDVKSVGKTLGVSFINWSVDTLDWKTKDAKAVHDEIMKNASDGAIILCHDLHKTTVDAMETVIPELIAQGYQLVTVSQLMEHSDKTIEPGNVYFRQ